MLIVTYEFWNEIKDLIPEKKSKVGRPEFDRKKTLDGILYVLKTGCQWKHLPFYYGKPTTIHGKVRHPRPRRWLDEWGRLKGDWLNSFS